MVSLRLTALALAALRATAVFAQIPEGLQVEELEELPGDLPIGSEQLKPATLAVDVKTSFPQSEIFGVKLVNGHATRAVLDITNHEEAPVTLSVVGGSLMTPRGLPGAPDPPVILRNLTAHRYGFVIPPGGFESVSFTFATELHPQDLTLNLAAVFQTDDNLFTRVVYNETVSVVEAPISIFDPQIIFLYLFLAAAFGGTCYFIYTTWITTLFPQKRRGAGAAGKGGERAKRSTTGSKKVDPAQQVGVTTGVDGPAVASGVSHSYDESWIPKEHLKRPEPKRVGSGRPKSRAA